MTHVEKVVAFAVGCVPSPIHMKYLDMSTYFKPGSGQAGSLGLACHMASGIVGTETARILLNRPGSAAPPLVRPLRRLPPQTRPPKMPLGATATPGSNSNAGG